MLEGLGMVRTVIKAKPWPHAITLEGPRLRDVLAAAGWNGSKITTVALDGFAVEISAADIAAHDWILALRRMGPISELAGTGRPGWSMKWLAARLPRMTSLAGPGQCSISLRSRTMRPQHCGYESALWHFH